MAKRYIDADALLLKIDLHGTNKFGMLDEDIREFVKQIPTADVEEVKHGEWIYKHRHRGGFVKKIGYEKYGNLHTITVDERYETDDPYCSECGKLGETFLNYCANCGAKMDGGKGDDNEQI